MSDYKNSNTNFARPKIDHLRICETMLRIRAKPLRISAKEKSELYLRQTENA